MRVRPLEQHWFILRGRFLAFASRCLRIAFAFVVEPLGNLLGVPLMIELQEPGEDFTAGGFADREPASLLGLVEAVTQIEVGPAVGGGNYLVHIDVEVT